MNKIAAVVGVGPGLGAAVAKRFAKEGYAVALMARGENKLTPVAESIEADGGRALSVLTDASAPASVNASFQKVRTELGDPTALIYNASAFQMGGALEISAEVFEDCWKINCLGGFLAAQAVLPRMAERGQGSIIFTGATASLRGSARFSCLAVGKFGLRALAQSLAREFGPQGIHVAHAIIDGQIDTPRLRGMQPDRAANTLLDPKAIAETYWQLHTQDRTCWSLEVDLRPAVEQF